MSMIRDYLIDATYKWITDHGFTPYLLADTEYPDTLVPKKYIGDDGKILFNISYDAITDYKVCDGKITFDAAFDGEPFSMVIPTESVLELYADETSQGMYAREFGYGISINEGETEDDVNPRNHNIKSTKSSGLKLV